MKQNVLMFVSNPLSHDPRVRNEATSILKNGGRVTVIGWDRRDKFSSREILDGIRVVRLRNTALMRLLPYDLFRLPFWRKNAYAVASKLHQTLPFDIIHCHDLDTLPMGIRFKKKYRIPLVYDAHEIWGDMVRGDLPDMLADHYLASEKKMLGGVDYIITVSEPLKEYFGRNTLTPVSVVMNCKPLPKVSPSPPENDEMVVLFVGTMGVKKLRAVMLLLDAVKGLKGVRVTIAGSAPREEYIQELKDKVRQVKGAEFMGRLKMEEVIPMTGRADVIYCMIPPDDPNSARGLPNKLFEAMVCARPVLTTSGTYRGFLVEQVNCGVAVPFNKTEVRKALHRLNKGRKWREQLGQNGLEAAKNEYSWEKQMEKLFSVYRKLSG